MPSGVTVGLEVPWSIAGIHGSTEIDRPSCGAPSDARVTVSSTVLVPTTGGGEASSSTWSVRESLITVIGNDPDDDAPGAPEQPAHASRASESENEKDRVFMAWSLTAR